MEYHSMKELFAVADVEKCSPGIIACRVEAEESGKSYEQVWDRMKYTIPVFREAIRKGLADTSKSASGLVGGDGSRLFNGNMRFMSPICQKAASYAIATAEANAKMYRIVACPTAGSCGILPAVLSAVGEEVNASMYDFTCALFTAGAIGRVIA
ncbi:L-serine ammonia-lyase, iron-sulfur-dependent, subunit beta [uncultured Dialister sp.]|nr:L-serine ammonia-lyase, iron-sulfur-dependent, subunit alpha [uncultured Dialister sp.]